MTDSGWSAFASKKTNHGSNAFQEREATVAAKKERNRYDEAVNISSESAYPSLGSATTKPILTLNYKAAALTKPAINPEPEPKPKPTPMAPKAKKAKAKAPSINKQCSVYEATYEYSEEEGEEGEEEEGEREEEYNADTIATTRRGDKGLW